MHTENCWRQRYLKVLLQLLEELFLKIRRHKDCKAIVSFTEEFKPT